ncbi:hypothetical protein [Sorangium sp. So ce233]|uniref:hypothetical protein n=1 Tax=Sorangium sp. So ce233 TaxID=3133290 RepID=UPI003F62D431
MRRSEERRVVSAYVTDRLREECRQRGKASAIARATHFTRVHVAAVARGDNAVGEDFARAMAKYWGMSAQELDAAAARWAEENGVEIPAPRSGPPQRLREREEWAEAVEAARLVFKGIPDEYFERVGAIFDDVPQRIDAQFVGEMARILHDLANREGGDPPKSAALRTGAALAPTKKASKH